MRPFLRCALCPSGARGIGASGARSQRRRPKFWGLSCKCDLQLDPDLVRTCCLLTARDDAVLCSTPCFCSCSAVLLFVPISATRLSARERESKSVARSPARSRNAKPAVLRKSLLVVFAVKTFFSSSSGAPQALENLGWAGRAGEARLLYWGWPQRPPSAGAGGHPAVPRRGTLLRRRRKFFELVAGGGRFGGQ